MTKDSGLSPPPDTPQRPSWYAIVKAAAELFPDDDDEEIAARTIAALKECSGEWQQELLVEVAVGTEGSGKAER